MDTFLQLPASRRLLAFQQVDEMMGLQAVSVEKDFWVCWTLRELFSLPDVGGHLTFKGGTSLSKAWKLIERFSEDIDIIVDKEVLGFGGEAAPDHAPSNKQRKARLELLMDACREWVQGTLQPALASRIREQLGETGWQLEVDPDIPDGQCLLFQYPSVFPPGAAGYVRPVVKIELGARSDDWPHEEKPILPYVTEQFPAFDPAPAFPVRVLSAERTFWEKACLLHEETFRPAGKPRKIRMARHYYDLWCLLRAGVGDRALAQKVRNIFVSGLADGERVSAKVDDSVISSLASGIAGRLGGEVGLAPRIFLKKLVLELLDVVELKPDFNPHEHYQPVITGEELNDAERSAIGAVSPDEIQLDL